MVMVAPRIVLSFAEIAKTTTIARAIRSAWFGQNRKSVMIGGWAAKTTICAHKVWFAELHIAL